MSYVTTLLAPNHKKEQFFCGNELLDNYLHRQAKQDMKRQLAACFVLSPDGIAVQGYYTLSNASIPKINLPDALGKKLPPSYNYLPATLLGRLATDLQQRGQGLGRLLLLDALKRSLDVATTSIGSMAMIVDPIDNEAIRFYSKYGFVLMEESGRMFMAMSTVALLFQ